MPTYNVHYRMWFILHIFSILFQRCQKKKKEHRHVYRFSNIFNYFFRPTVWLLSAYSSLFSWSQLKVRAAYSQPVARYIIQNPNNLMLQTVIDGESVLRQILFFFLSLFVVSSSTHICIKSARLTARLDQTINTILLCFFSFLFLIFFCRSF